MKTGLVVTLLALLALYLFNPSMDDFKVFVEGQSERILQRELGDGMLGRALSGAGSRLAGSYIDRVTEREDYFIFSTYTIDLDGAEADKEEWRFLGIGGRFVELDRPAALPDNR